MATTGCRLNHLSLLERALTSLGSAAVVLGRGMLTGREPLPSDLAAAHAMILAERGRARRGAGQGRRGLGIGRQARDRAAQAVARQDAPRAVRPILRAWRQVQTKDRPTRLARALEELGRIVKTLYLLRSSTTRTSGGASWCSSTATRAATARAHGVPRQARRAAPALPRGPGGPARRLGPRRQRRSCSGTRSTWTRRSNRLRAEGYDVRDEDVARLSPLGFDHINMLGRYAFVLPEAVARGELRPLRDPRHTADEG